MSYLDEPTLEMIDKYFIEQKKALEENLFKRVTIRKSNNQAYEGILIRCEIPDGSNEPFYDYILVQIYIWNGTRRFDLCFCDTQEIISLITYPPEALISFEEAITSDCIQLREQALKHHPHRPLC